MTSTRVLVGAVLLSCFAASASAQTYVSASLSGDVVRHSHTQDSGFELGSGEALGFALRLGTAITDRWGVELEFARPAEITSEATPDVFPLGSSSSFSFDWRNGGFTSIGVSAGPVFPDRVPLPAFSSSLRSTDRTSTLGTTAWVQQQLWDRATLVYLGGLAFHRHESTTEYSFDFVGLPAAVRPPILPPRAMTSIAYSVRPVVGIEGRIDLSEHVQLVPGVRMHGIEQGWLLRPSVGLGWVF